MGVHLKRRDFDMKVKILARMPCNLVDTSVSDEAAISILVVEENQFRLHDCGRSFLHYVDT
jgi:hypothetical protein